MLAAVPACPKCATDNPDIARFCLACGAQLDNQSPIAPLKERKVITAHYGLEGQAPRTMKELHTEMGLPRAELRDVLGTGLAKLRTELA